MKKGMVFGLIIFASLILLGNFVLAATEDENTKINKAYLCLENKVNATTCSYLTDEQKFFSLLAIGKCLPEVEAAAASNNTCWSKPESNCAIKPTAQGILALSSVSGKDTSAAEGWLLNHNATAKNLVWLLQIESGEATSCTVKTDASTDTVNIGADKKINSVSGNTCFTPFGQAENYGGNYWLKVKDNCYNKDIEISCDKNFLTTMLYKKDSSVSTPIYVSNAPQSANAGESTHEQVTSYCFSTSGVCDTAEYESTLWAASVLKMKGHDISAYMPYLVTLAEDYEEYVPYAFIYSITHDTEYLSQLWDLQNEQGFWDGLNSKFYSTAAGLLPFAGQENVQQKDRAKEWLLKSQDTSGNNAGCWNSGNIRDTAFLLASVWGNFVSTKETCSLDADCLPGQVCKNGICIISSDECAYDSDCTVGEVCDEGVCVDDSTKDCESQGLFCISSTACFDAVGQQNDALNCPGLNVCCNKPEVLKTCAEQNGKICTTNQNCGGSSVLAQEGSCCLGNCVDISQNSCSGSCRTSCMSGETEITGECNSVLEVCCKTGTTPKKTPWVWIIILVVLIVLIGLAIIFREKLKEMWIKMRTRKSGSGGNRPAGSGLPPRGLPPPRPGMMPPRNMPQRRPGEMDETLKKLREMSGR
ncbi:hypothetical protein J4474_02165 [Candidatus Pacearchaeota archaeon]|nr:hypothetical protein [Candidatus Pacearchaeota archaeon]